MTDPVARRASRIEASHAPRGLAIIGDPVEASLSPIFQQAALDALGIPLRYGRVRVGAAEVPALLATWRQTGTGGNVTMPHKARVASLVEQLTPVARRAGAVNTVWVEGDGLVGHNTDVDGVVATFRAMFPMGITGSVVLVGAGGAAAAVLLAMEAYGVQAPVVVARDLNKARHLIERVEVPAHVMARPADPAGWRRMFGALSSTPALVVNATPIGMAMVDGASPVSALAPASLPVPLETLPQGVACFDLVYHRADTAWVRGARAMGYVAEDGLRMLVEQGAAAFQCWFGRPAPRDVMWEAVGRSAGPRG